jgi:hypothetical protein
VQGSASKAYRPSWTSFRHRCEGYSLRPRGPKLAEVTPELLGGLGDVDYTTLRFGDLLIERVANAPIGEGRRTLRSRARGPRGCT